MRRILYVVDLIMLDFGLVIGYYIRKIQESIKRFFELMQKELEEADKKENNLYD